MPNKITEFPGKARLSQDEIMKDWRRTIHPFAVEALRGSTPAYRLLALLAMLQAIDEFYVPVSEVSDALIKACARLNKE